MAIFTGSGVAIATPMKKNGEIDYPAFEKLIENSIAKDLKDLGSVKS